MKQKVSLTQGFVHCSECDGFGHNRNDQSIACVHCDGNGYVLTRDCKHHFHDTQKLGRCYWLQTCVYCGVTRHNDSSD